MQLLLTKFWVLAHLLVTAGTLCFFPGSAGLALWASLASLMALLLLPPVMHGEGFYAARTRVWRHVTHDAFVYAALLAVCYLGIQLLNAPRPLTFDPELRRWVFASAPLPLFPSSLSGGGSGHWAGLLGGLTAAVAIRAALPRRQRVVLLVALALLTGLAGTLAAWFRGLGSDGLLTCCGGADALALTVFLMGCVALGVAAETFLEGHRKTFAWTLAAVALDFAALAALASCTLLALTGFILIVWLVFVPLAVRLAARYPRTPWLLALMLPPVLGFGLGLAADGAMDVAAALFEPATLTEPLGVFWEQWAFRCGLAANVFGSEPMLGIGPEGFTEAARFFVRGRAEWALWKSASGVPCDFMLLLAEQGMMGTLLLLLPGATLIGGVLMGVAEIAQERRASYSYRYVFVLIGSSVGVVSTLLFSLVGSPLHAPLTLCVFLTVCACMAGWMPRRR